MLVLDAETVAARLSYARLIPALRTALAEDVPTPQRTHYSLADGASMLVMPAWNRLYLGTKMVNVFPANTALGKSAISSIYVLSDAATGEMQALIDGETLTVRRTAAVAALAASYLAPPGANTLLLVGAGRVALELPSAMAAVRPINTVVVWARNSDRATAFARAVASGGFDVSVCGDLGKAAGTASIIACATFSTEPIIRGEWLGTDTHLSLIGSFRPHMREADSEAVRRSYVVADTREGVLAESGDLLAPIAEKVVGADHVKADLFELCRTGANSQPYGMPTLFKSVGHARQDLAAAGLCMPDAAAR